MTDVDTLRTQLDDLITWWPHLTDHAATLHGITGHGLNLTATPHTGTSSVETAATEHLHLTNITTPLEAIATEWAWRGHHHDGNLLTYLRSRLSWAANHFPLEPVCEAVGELHAKVAVLTGHAPARTDRTCPGCGEARLQRLEDQMLYCPVCDLTRTPDEVEALTKWRAASADLSVRPREAAKLLGIPEQTVYAWVRRGLLNRRDGLVSLADVASVRKDENND